MFRITLLDINLEMIEKPGKEAKLSNQPGYIDLCAKAALVLIAIYLALIVIYILLRKTIAEEEDVKNWLRMTCLGITPYVKIIGKKKYPLISADGSRYFDLKDSVGSIRRHLEKDAKKNEHKSYLFTGAVEGEGTTTTVANLALSLAAKGYKTALLDLDLRKSMLPTVMKNLIVSKEDKEAQMQGVHLCACDVDKFPKLHIYCAKKQKGKVTKILGSDEIRILLEKLHEKYDFVLFDSPPILPGDDAAVLAEQVDATVFVIKADHLSADRVTEAMEILNHVTDSIVGCVLNGSKHQMS